MTKDKTREALLEHGTRLILEQGYNHTGVLAILQAAGVPKGSFYHYFRNKEEFGLSVLQRYFDQHMANVERFLSDASKPPLLRLRQCFEFYVDYFQKHDCRWGCLLGNLSQELADQSPAFRAQLGELIGKWTSRVADCLKEARDRGEVAQNLDPLRTAEFCVNSWEGALLAMKAVKDLRPLHTFLAFFFDRLCAKSIQG